MKKLTHPSENSLNAYLHIYHLLKKVQGIELLEPEEDPFQELVKKARKWRIPKEDREDWVRRAYKEANLAQADQLGWNDPFRRVKWAMVYTMYNDDGLMLNEPKKRQGPPRNWAFNFLLYALVNDMKLLTGQPEYKAALGVLDNHEIKEVLSFSPDNLRKDFDKIDFYGPDGIMSVLEILYEACCEAGKPFLPPNITIPEYPIDTLVDIADSLGIKYNKYIRAEEPLPEDYRAHIASYKKSKKLPL